MFLLRITGMENGTRKTGSRTFSHENVRLLHAVYEHLDATLALGGLVLVDDALRGGLVELAAGSLCCQLGGVLVASLHGSADLLDVGLEFRANRTVADACLLGGENALLLRLNVCHVLTLSVMYIEASTLRHGYMWRSTR